MQPKAPAHSNAASSHWRKKANITPERSISTPAAINNLIVVFIMYPFCRIPAAHQTVLTLPPKETRSQLLIPPRLYCMEKVRRLRQQCHPDKNSIPPHTVMKSPFVFPGSVSPKETRSKDSTHRNGTLQIPKPAHCSIHVIPPAPPILRLCTPVPNGNL